MLFSLRTPKNRIEMPNGDFFYNDFNNALHAEINGEHTVLAVNLGASNWTISTKGELAFLMPAVGGGIQLVITDPMTKQRVIQKPPPRFDIYNILLTDDMFFAAVPSMLVAGRRGDNGEPVWSRVRSIDRGAGYLFQTDDGRSLGFTKRGSCSVFQYDTLTGEKTETPDSKRLEQILFTDAFLPSRLPDIQRDIFPSADMLLGVIEKTAAEHKLTDKGVRLYALLAYIRNIRGNSADIFNRLLMADCDLQYSALINEPFPSLPLFQTVFNCKTPEDIRQPKLIPKKLLRWSRLFEADKSFARRSRPVGTNEYREILC